LEAFFSREPASARESDAHRRGRTREVATGKRHTRQGQARDRALAGQAVERILGDLAAPGPRFAWLSPGAELHQLAPLPAGGPAAVRPLTARTLALLRALVGVQRQGVSASRGAATATLTDMHTNCYM
ncbi:MAG TPA: hypothetical protein VMU90_00500, partial [Solirubrobacteraceae bacterium]|nr:hypothetical protein [Solirubrobacteraceae bacterium]